MNKKRTAIDKPPVSDDHIVTALVPYRNRQVHLATLIDMLYGYSRRSPVVKKVNIVVVQQNDDFPFNAGAIRNVAFLEAVRLFPDTTWVTFVDVDNVPMDGSVPIKKPEPKELIKVFGHYHSIGGIWSIRVNDFLDVDGSA